MKILFAGAYLPYPLNSGGRIRSYHLLKALAVRHEVHLLALRHEDISEADLHVLRTVCGSVNVVPAPPRPTGPWPRVWRLVAHPEDIVVGRVSQEMERELRCRLETESWDLLFLDDLGMESYLRLAGRTPVLLSKHNSEWLLLRRLASQKSGRPLAWGLAWLEALAARRCERRTAALVGGVIVTSETDRQALLSCAPQSRVFVVPNGADTTYFHPEVRPTQAESCLVFTGAMFWHPNVDAVSWFCQDVLPLIQRQEPHVRLEIVGREPPAAVQRLGELPGVHVTGSVGDVRPYLAQATVYVAPLRTGSGTRLKILEALAAGRAVVSTSIGIEGLALVPGEEVIVSDEAVAFSRSVVELLQNPSKRDALEQAGRRVAVSLYDWPIVLADLNRMCAQMAGGREE